MRSPRRPLLLLASLVVTLDLWAAVPPAADASVAHGAAEQGSGCFVPRLHGLRVGTAKIVLEWANCSLGTITYRHTVRRLRGVVVAQALPPDTYAVSGHPVGITIGSKKRKPH